MKGVLELTHDPIPSGRDELRFASHGITGNINFHKFNDADTGQFVFYSPSLELSGYGETEEKALEMIKSAITDYFTMLYEISPKKRDIELRTLGWNKAWLRNKDFSKAFVDGDGALQNMNIVNHKVERVSLVA